MSVIGSNVLAGASGQAVGAAGYEIQRSLRFDSSSSSYLNRTPSSAGNRKTWTWSSWVKTHGADSRKAVFGTYASGICQFRYMDNGRVVFQLYDGTGYGFETSRVFRDPSAWHHIVLSVDTTLSTSGDRIKFYVNGSLVSSAEYVSFTAPPQNFETVWNNNALMNIGRTGETGYQYDFDGYLADVHFIDGQALAPTDFGEYDDNNVWQPIEYAGSYGTNGFRLDFSDNSSNAALGDDSSGNNNTWTVNNLSVASGAGNDSLIDTPTNYEAASGNNGGNYATLNPLNMHNSNNSFSNGNLEFTTSGSDGCLQESTIGMSSGKFYFEVVYSRSGTGQLAGIRKPGSRNYNDSYIYVGTANKYTNGGSGAGYGATLAHGDVIGTAFDADNGTLTFYKNGVSQGQAFSGISGTYAFFVGSFGGAPTGIVNFGQRPFAYTAPSGFKALCTTNFDDPTIADGSTAMDVVTYTGNGSTQTISGLNLASAPDLVWIKQRNTAKNHGLYDIIRGATKRLTSNGTNAEITDANLLTSFNSNGFSVGNDSEVNESSGTYAAWTWDGGTSTVSNTDGSITSSVRANASAGFSIVSFNSGASGSQTIGHGLNAAPAMIFVKNRDAVSNWTVYHSSGTSISQYLLLNSTGAVASYANIWGSADPTSSVFGLASGANQSANVDCIAYCFAPVEGYSAFGSYTGNGSTDGPFVYTGFRPRFILLKRYDASGNSWNIYDTARNSFNVVDKYLFPDTNSAEGTITVMDIVSNGFKIRNTGGFNTSGGTYIYAAFAEHPFKTARAR